MNLNAFINPDGNSSLLSDRPTFPLQYEGFNYWGLGLICLFLLSLLFSKCPPGKLTSPGCLTDLDLFWNKKYSLLSTSTIGIKTAEFKYFSLPMIDESC